MSGDVPAFVHFIDGNPVVATVAAANTTASGAITTDVAGAGNTVECTVSPGASTVGCQIVGLTALGNLVRFEGTTDGTNWVSIYTSMGASAVQTTGQDGIYQLGGSGYTKVRVRGLAAWAVGSVAVSMNSTVGASAVVISTPLPQGSNNIGSVSVINGKTIKSIVVNISATGTVIAAVATKKIKVFAVKLILSADLSLNFRDGAATLLEGPMPMLANSGYVESVTPPMFLFCTTAGASLDLVIVGAGSVLGRISYWDDDIT